MIMKINESIMILFCYCLFFSCSNNEAQESSRQGENKTQKMKESGSESQIAKFLLSIECKDEKIIENNYKKASERILKLSELFSILEKNPQFECFLKANIVSVTAYNYDVFINDYCNRYVEIFDKCYQMLDEHISCLRGRYKNKVFFKLEKGINNGMKKQTILDNQLERIFVDAQTGELIDELVQEIDNKSCKGPFYDKEGKIIKE